MKLPSRATVVSAVAAFAILTWMYGTDLLDTVRANSSEVSALTGLPSPFFAAGILLFTLGATAAFISGAARNLGPQFRGYRLLPILAVLALFVDLFVLPGVPPAFPSFTTTRAIEGLAQAARGEGGQLVTDQAALNQIATRLGTPHYLVRGQPVPSFTIEVRHGCEGPALERRSAAPATLIFCLNERRDRAWITAVTLPDDRRFGDASIFTVSGVPYVGQVGASTPAAVPSTTAGGG